MVQPLCNVMSMVIAIAEKDSQAVNAVNANQMSLVTNVMHVNQITSIIHHVKVCCHKRDSNSGLFNYYIHCVVEFRKEVNLISFCFRV